MEFFKLLVLALLGLILPELEGMQKVKGTFTKPKNIMRSTAEPQAATKLFTEHGVSVKGAIASKRHVCQPLNEQSNQIRGKPLCGCAVRLLQLHSRMESSVTLTSANIECVQTTLVSSLWNSVKEKDIAHRKTAGAIAKCPLTDGSHFYVVNSSVQNFYYIMKEQSGAPGCGIIMGCFQDTGRANDFTEVAAEVTDDPVKADDIFGIHGTLQERGDKEEPKKVRNILPYTACKEAMNNNQYIQERWTNLLKNQIDAYQAMRFARRLMHPSSGDRVATHTYMVLYCRATRIATGAQSQFQLLRGPNQNLAYVLDTMDDVKKYGRSLYFTAVVNI